MIEPTETTDQSHPFTLAFYDRTEEQVRDFYTTHVEPRYGADIIDWKVEPLKQSVNVLAFLLAPDALQLTLTFKSRALADRMFRDTELQEVYMLNSCNEEDAEFMALEPGDPVYKLDR